MLFFHLFFQLLCFIFWLLWKGITLSVINSHSCKVFNKVNTSSLNSAQPGIQQRFTMLHNIISYFSSNHIFEHLLCAGHQGYIVKQW